MGPGPVGVDFESTQPGTSEYEMGGAVPGDMLGDEGPLTEERMMSIVKLFLTTTPSIFKKPWLATPEEDLQPFVHELTIYCRNHDIDPSEYFGDWFPVAMCALPVGAGILERHREHKKEAITEDKHKNITEDSVTASEHTPVERKTPELNATGAGGSNLPEPEEEIKEDFTDERQGNAADDASNIGIYADTEATGESSGTIH